MLSPLVAQESLAAVLAHGPVALVLTDSLVALGTGPLFALGTGLVVGGVPPQRAGSAAALAEVSNHLGGTVGITVFGTTAAFVYQPRLRTHLPRPASRWPVRPTPPAPCSPTPHTG